MRSTYDRKLGQGGFGTVFKARRADNTCVRKRGALSEDIADNVEHRSQVAVKLIRWTDSSKDKEVSRRFARSELELW